MNAAKQLEKAQLRLHAELFEAGGISLGSYVTDGEDRLIIGSSKRADLIVPHTAVSEIHAMLRIVGNANILLYDLGSERGTFVAGRKIIERHLNPGETFEVGGHQVKVKLVDHSCDERASGRATFWQADCGSTPDYLEMIRVEEEIVRDEKTLAKNQRIHIGRRKNEILINGVPTGDCFLHRKTDRSECFLPPGYVAEIYDGANELLRIVEQEGAAFAFSEQEKARLVSADQKREILLFWRHQGIRTSRRSQDNESPTLQRALLVCATLAGVILAFLSYVPLQEEKLEEALAPKSSYFRLSMDSAPAQEAPAPAAQAEAAKSEAAPQQVSKAASISSSLTKLLSKKPSLTAENIQQAISQNGTQTARGSNLKSASMKTENIAAGAIGGSGVNANALSAGLSAGGNGKAGALKGFANGKGTTIGGTGSGFGKSFDMSLGGEEAEAIGGLDKSLIAAVVQANIGQIKHCYERQLIVDPNIFGKVVAQWTINKDGAVSVTSVKKTTMNNAPVENCILGKIKGWNFPKPKGGGQVLVSYPFLFKSLN